MSSEPQEATLLVGEEKKFDVSGDNYYDVLVKLNSITGTRASITMQTIHEAMSPEADETEGGVTDSLGDWIGEEGNSIYYIVLGVILVVLVVGVIAYLKLKSD